MHGWKMQSASVSTGPITSELSVQNAPGVAPQHPPTDMPHRTQCPHTAAGAGKWNRSSRL